MAADKPKSKKKADEPEHAGSPPHKKVERETYEAELNKLQGELVKLQEWICLLYTSDAADE